jgi:hypothetical protein
LLWIVKTRFEPKEFPMSIAFAVINVKSLMLKMEPSFSIKNKDISDASAIEIG